MPPRLVLRPLLTLEPPQQGGLPGAVGADHCDTTLRLQSERDVPQDGAAHFSDRETRSVELEKRSAEQLGLRQLDLRFLLFRQLLRRERLDIDPGPVVAHKLQASVSLCLTAARNLAVQLRLALLGLPQLVRVRLLPFFLRDGRLSHLLDHLLRALPFPVVGLQLRNDGLSLLPSPLFPRGVVARALFDVLPADLDYVCHHVVQECPVVRNHHKHAVGVELRLQEMLEPQDACEVEVVRRLVEEQAVSSREKSLRQS
mmetsp:Transcript_68022/g.189979  ORF Transcript_68022/g.189979 Transcript_68022/m.189979 type:complete len:257 (+) Transcript_68022:907-1677(+)